MRAISRKENAQRRHHGGIRRNAEDLGLQPWPTDQPADQRPYCGVAGGHSRFGRGRGSGTARRFAVAFRNGVAS